MKKKLLSLMLLGAAFAANAAAVESCPSVDLIKAQGITHAEYYMSYGYIAYNTSKYDTDKDWVFAIAFVDAKDADTAVAEGNALLPQVNGQPKPEFNTSYRAWVCQYQLDNNHFAIAETGRDITAARRTVEIAAK